MARVTYTYAETGYSNFHVGHEPQARLPNVLDLGGHRIRKRSSYVLSEQYPVALIHGTREGYVGATRPLLEAVAQIKFQCA